MPFARIATLASVTVLFAPAGCGDSRPTPAAEREPATADVRTQSATDSPGPALSGPPAAPTSSPPRRPKRTRPHAGLDAAGMDGFVAAVRRKLPDLGLDRRDEEIEDLGRQACDALGKGHDAGAAAGGISAQGVPPADARALVGLARGTLCRS